EAARSDIVIVQGWAMHDHPWLADLPVVLVADLYDAIHLETLEADRDRSRTERRHSMQVATEVLMAQIRRGDFFLCASTRQRDLWLGHLAAAGRLNPDTYDGDEALRGFIAEVPFGVSPTSLSTAPGAIKGVVPGIGPDDEVILWGGGIYNWFDPLTLIRAVALVHDVRPQVRLYFLGTRHPNPAVPEMAMAASAVALAERLGLVGSVVFFNEGWVPYEHRSRWLADADIGISCHFEHLETAYSFRTRMLDYLWAGLPIVATDGDVFADLIRARGLGAVVAPEDVDGLTTALIALLGDSTRLAACREQVALLAAEMRWERLAEPLLEFCRRPRRAPDRQLPAPLPPTRAAPAGRVAARLRPLAARVRRRL
ncbi:MAG TPA: glycosyltransferase family 4 protein, partial [Mycobacteriales bacterium]